MMGLIVNEKTSLKDQVLRSFCVITLISCGVTLAICYGLLFALGSSTYYSAKVIIVDQAESNAQLLSKEIAGAAEVQLRFIAESICLTSSLYSSVLLNYSSVSASNYSTLFKPSESFREYNFAAGCIYPDCPNDFGELAHRSRLPYLPGFVNGSTEHSSVFLYSETIGKAARNDSEWQSITSEFGSVNQVIDGLAYQDTDFSVMYSRGPNTTVMFYLSAEVTENGVRNMVHRTYPGIEKNSTSYDPSQRSWFKNAPVDSYYLYGPYRETFTRQLVLTVSSRQYVDSLPTSGASATVVSAAVLLIDDLRSVVNEVTYTNSGFGAMVTYSESAASSSVLVWGNRTDVYDEGVDAFKTIADFDAELAKRDISSNSVIEYTDPEGIDWIVCATPFLPTSRYGSDTVKQNALIMLVFAQRYEAEYPLHALKTSIDSTTSSVSVEIAVTIGITVGVVMALVCVFVHYITSPLETMRAISERIIHMAAEDEENKDYSDLVQRAFFNLSRSDEVGLLASDYYHVLCTLHNKNVEKSEIPKYPANPLHVSGVADYATFSWSALMQLYRVQKEHEEQKLPVPVEVKPEVSPPVSKMDGNLDILGALAAELAKAQKPPRSSYAAVAVCDGVDSGDVEMGAVPSSTAAPPGPRMDGTRQARATTKSSDKTYIALPSGVPTQVGYLTSLKSQLYGLCAILLCGIVIAASLTIAGIQADGHSWMSESSAQLESKQLQNLQGIAASKASFVQTYFEQMGLDLLVGASFTTLLLDKELTRSEWEADGQYLASYSIDTHNPYSYPDSSSSVTFSGYYLPEAAQCETTADNCARYQDYNMTRLTSLTDIKYRAYFHSDSYLSFIQIGLDRDGLTRYLPYQQSSTNSYPTTCLVGSLYSSYCLNRYETSLCSSDSGAYGGYEYPAYDPRCRSWYALGATEGHPQEVMFQYPRIASNGDYVVTAIVPIRANQSVRGEMYGVINSNYLASTLSDSVNSVRILDSGYVFLVDSANTSHIIIHPSATSDCQYVQCAEGFTDAEFAEFNANFLQPIQNGAAVSMLPNSYTKRAKAWRIIAAKVQQGAVDYTLFATVPNAEVLEASSETEDAISASTDTLIGVFVVLFVLFALCIFCVTRVLVRSIVGPVNDLRSVLSNVKTDNLTGHIPAEAKSADVKILLDAFSRLMVALRFGSDHYARGNMKEALSVYEDALELFTATGNKKGIGKSLNNLATVRLALGDSADAEELFQRAISNAKEQLEETQAATYHDDEERKRRVSAAEHVYSDRRGNLANLYIETDRFPTAFGLLESLLVEDKKSLYIRGCVVKQGALCQYYIKQGEFQSAQRILESALLFIRTMGNTVDRDDAAAENSQETESQPTGVKHAVVRRGDDTVWDHNEATVSEQIALYNLAFLLYSRREPMAAVEAVLMECLTKFEVMHLSTTNKALMLLRGCFANSSEPQKATEVEIIAKELGFSVYDELGGGVKMASKKRVVFAIDYSGSMAGTKIRSAVENMQSIFEKQLRGEDMIGIVRFNKEVTTCIDLRAKQNNEQFIANCIGGMTAPTGSTRLYDAINASLNVLITAVSNRQPDANDWLVVLTDGEDNGSGVTLEQVTSKISSVNIGVIVIGVGSDVQAELLMRIAKASKQGFYVFAQGDKKSIDDAFGQVALLIQGQMLLEEF